MDFLARAGLDQAHPQLKGSVYKSDSLPFPHRYPASHNNMFRLVCNHTNAVVPARGTPGSAGYDLSACEPATIPAFGRGLVDTGIVIQIPMDCYARIAPRSGLAVKHGIQVGAGVVDSDWRGNIKVLLINTGTEPFVVEPGMRIAQLVLERIYTPEWTVVPTVEELTETERGANGFGSTGV